MTKPIFVLHGTSNRDPKIIRTRVSELAAATGERWQLVPVYWGDLGAQDEWFDRILPDSTRRGREDVRDGDEPGPESDDVELLAISLARALDSDSTPVEPDERTQLAAVEQGIRTTVSDGWPIPDELADSIVEATAQTWSPERFWLSQVDDPTLLRAIGQFLVEDVTDALEEIELRDETRLHDAVRRRLDSLDNLVGAALKRVASNVNAYTRRRLAPAMARNFGDVIVYQRRWREIHDRVREVIASVDPALGTDDKHRVHLIGHSLGATIALDMAIGAMEPESPPLWTDSVITFGSPWPLFHLCDPRHPNLVAIEAEGVVRLPKTVNRWTNLWEPADPLAFLASDVFRMYDGTQPKDVEVRHSYTTGLATHSAYWQTAELMTEMSRVFGT
ncbi:hypothetical protein JOF56_006974 [Kibdelosporangium banguiense]|uniref:Alpha/beta hydrolase n=1 Tax=Kibdelosporangium banguiense TaxID=1365924 RepID=A0ABS4TRH4_9PSEU|nr:hypothetical protein [Kibdelosporangium banguiense]MBP2326589.1 hypothetical protein [Kibdelosporangium banguiense]